MNREVYFEKIYKENYPKVMGLCFGYVSGNEDLAKDLAQEVFLKVWQNLKNFKGESAIATWIYRITVNTCLQELRRKNPVNLNIDVAAEVTANQNEKESKFAKMYHCINKLSPENKTIILLELEEVPQQEIAKITGTSHQAIRTRIYRIKDQLSKCVYNE